MTLLDSILAQVRNVDAISRGAHMTNFDGGHAISLLAVGLIVW